MKKFWKNALRLATLATVVPVSITHDDITGKTTYRSLLASLAVGTGKDGINSDVSISLGDGVLSGAVNQLIAAKKESELYADSELTAAKAEGPAIVRTAQEAQVPTSDFVAPETGETPETVF